MILFPFAFSLSPSAGERADSCLRQGGKCRILMKFFRQLNHREGWRGGQSGQAIHRTSGGEMNHGILGRDVQAGV